MSRTRASSPAIIAVVIIVFVYGTLLRGEDNHRLLDRARYLGDARTTASFTLLDLGAWPAMIAGGSVVHGELYGVDAATLRELDELEGHPDEYRRTAIELADGRTADAYLLVEPVGARVIDSGDWRRR